MTLIADFDRDRKSSTGGFASSWEGEPYGETNEFSPKTASHHTTEPILIANPPHFC